MVHALKESWRVLIPGGYLCDMRPVDFDYSLEIVRDNQVIPVGILDASTKKAGGLAADQAADQVVQAGFFVPEGEVMFPYYFYWDSLSELISYSSEKDPGSVISDAVLAQASERLAQIDSTAARICTYRQHKMICYRKQTLR